jgi:hypothetical protein
MMTAGRGVVGKRCSLSLSLSVRGVCKGLDVDGDILREAEDAGFESTAMCSFFYTSTNHLHHPGRVMTMAAEPL